MLVVKDPPVNAGNIRDAYLIPGLGRSPEEGHGNLPPVFLPRESHEQGAWWATVHRVAKSQTWLKQVSMHVHTINILIIISCLRYIPSSLQETKVGRALIYNDQKQEIAREIEVVYSLYLNKKMPPHSQVNTHCGGKILIGVPLTFLFCHLCLLYL